MVLADRPEPTPEDIRASYGFVGLLGDAVPEIRDLLNQAVAGKWTADRFVMSVASTSWWKNTPATQREWVVRLATDPAQAYTEMETGADQIRNLTAQLGVPMFSPEQAKEVWLWTKVAGYDENGVRAYVSRKAFELGGNQEAGGGRMGQLVQEMFQLSHDFGYTPSNLSSEILNHAQWLMSVGGSVDTTGWKSKMQEYASAFYAPYAEDIKGGKSVREVAQPIIARVSQLLEMNPDSLDMSDPVMKKALTEWNVENGVNRAYTLREIEDTTRKDSRWLKTDNAMEDAAKMMAEIGQRFGMVGGS